MQVRCKATLRQSCLMPSLLGGARGGARGGAGAGGGGSAVPLVLVLMGNGAAVGLRTRCMQLTHAA